MSLAFLFLFSLAYCDAPIPSQSNKQSLLNNLGFQDPASPIMEGIIALHSDIWAIMLFVAGFVLYILLFCIFMSRTYSCKVHHHSLIEIIWTTIPALILCVIAIPSFALLYSLDEPIEPSLTIKANAKQWYWSYEYGDFESNEGTGLCFDSNVLQEDDLEFGKLRLLEVDNRLVLPVAKHIRLLTTAGDVIHSFAIPSLGMKLDAIPGRLNQSMLFIKRQGIFYGQCSELCGVNHSMMPISVEAVDEHDFIDWINAKLQEV
jgi:cytochrome c oxidase subunit 2